LFKAVPSPPQKNLGFVKLVFLSNSISIVTFDYSQSADFGCAKLYELHLPLDQDPWTTFKTLLRIRQGYSATLAQSTPLSEQLTLLAITKIRAFYGTSIKTWTIICYHSRVLRPISRRLRILQERVIRTYLIDNYLLYWQLQCDGTLYC